MGSVVEVVVEMVDDEPNRGLQMLLRVVVVMDERFFDIVDRFTISELFLRPDEH